MLHNILNRTVDDHAAHLDMGAGSLGSHRVCLARLTIRVIMQVPFVLGTAASFAGFRFLALGTTDLRLELGLTSTWRLLVTCLTA